MDLIKEITSELNRMNFEVSETQYDSLIQHGDLKYLKSLKELPDGEASRLLKYFPQLFVVHKTAEPEKGIFFIVNTQAINKEATSVFEKYFPNQIVLVEKNSAGKLQAKWLHSSDQFLPFANFFQHLIS